MGTKEETIDQMEDWEKQAFEDMAKADQETLNNLKDDEVLFSNMMYYTIPKDDKRIEEHSAIISLFDDYLHILWSDTPCLENEDIEQFIEEKGDKIPSGTFYIKFWGYSERTSYEYDEWDYIFSENFEIEVFSTHNFERSLKALKPAKESMCKIVQKINNLIGKIDNKEAIKVAEDLKEFTKRAIEEVPA